MYLLYQLFISLCDYRFSQRFNEIGCCVCEWGEEQLYVSDLWGVTVLRLSSVPPQIRSFVSKQLCLFNQ